jgi:hypothetical protein
MGETLSHRAKHDIGGDLLSSNEYIPSPCTFCKNKISVFFVHVNVYEYNSTEMRKDSSVRISRLPASPVSR